MKNLLLIFIGLVANTLLISQTLEPGCDIVLLKQNIVSSEQGGKYLTASGELKVLLVFAKFKDDTSSHQFWPADSYPSEMDNYIDADTQTESTHFLNLTNYYNQMSFGNFKVTGKAIGVETPYPMSHYIIGNAKRPERWVANAAILNVVDDSIDYNEFDNWKYVDDYNHVNQPDGIIDMVVVIWRGLVFSDKWNGEMSLGYGQEFWVENHQKLIRMCHGGGLGHGSNGSGITVQYWGERTPERNFKVIIHELAHWLIQVDHPYGNFSPTFWGMLTLSTEGICANAFERERLGWLDAIPIEARILQATLSDYITTPSAYKYHPPNGNEGEMYYFENHQQISIYDNGNSNPNDKGIFILHFKNDSYTGECVRILTSDGFWDWEVPNHTDCWGNDLPNFKKVFVNRNGNGNRDKIIVDSSNSGFLYSYINENNQSECNDWLHGYGFINSFDTTFNDVFSPFSNPPAKTSDGQPVDFLMEVINQSGSSLTTRFETQNALDGKPSKPMLGLDPSKLNAQYQNNRIHLAWGSDVWDSQPIEPDVNWSELQLSTDSINYTTIYSGSDRYFTDNTFNYDSTGNSSVRLRVRLRDNQNKWSIWSNPINIKINNQSNRSSNSDFPISYDLYQNFPNPFNPSTTIRYAIPNAVLVTLKVYDVLGNEIATLVNEEKSSGSYEVSFSGSGLSSGIYFYSINAGSFGETKKIILLK
jgi:M6 family metalloprotease-like protein